MGKNRPTSAHSLKPLWGPPGPTATLFHGFSENRRSDSFSRVESMMRSCVTEEEQNMSYRKRGRRDWGTRFDKCNRKSVVQSV